MLTCSKKDLPAASICAVSCSLHTQQLDGLSSALLSPPDPAQDFAVPRTAQTQRGERQ